MNTATKPKPMSFRELFEITDWKSPSTYVFFLVQVFGVAWFVYFWGRWSWVIWVMIGVKYFQGMWFVTAFRHRYFSHRSFRIHPKIEKPVAVGAAMICSMDAQRGALKWAADHRWHHKKSDEPEDVHSCKQRGKWWCHELWVTKKDETPLNRAAVADLLKIPGIEWVENRQWLGILLGGAIFSAIGVYFSAGGYHSFAADFCYSVFAYFFATTALWHGTFSINSLMHLWGRQDFNTGDESRNSFLLSLITLGEGWHNNHHTMFPKLGAPRSVPGSVRVISTDLYWQGITPFQKCFDWTGISIWILIQLGVFQSVRKSR